MIGFEVVEEKIAEAVFAHAPKHGNICAKPCRGDGLIGSLAARDDLQVFAAYGFARLGKARRTEDKISIE